MKSSVKKIYKKSLFIFRRDLRIEDNTGLRMALEQSDVVIPCFIIDPVQVGTENKYKSEAAVQFMVQALDDLTEHFNKKKGRLYFFSGTPSKVVQQLIAQEKIDAVFVNRDYTPYSQKRDAVLEQVCKKYKIPFHACADVLLHDPEMIATKTGGFYSVFTPFYTAMMQQEIPHPITTKLHNFYMKPIQGVCADETSAIIYQPNKKVRVIGTRVAGLRILKHLESFRHYDKERDIPALDATTHLSAYIKFGLVSVREVYAAITTTLGKRHPLVRQLCWHDFFTHVAYHAPRVFGAPFREQYAHMSWNKDVRAFQRWCTGTTGFPLVDAGMRELVTTGYMHNRVRLVTASFLVKDLHIDWKKGEQFFAQHLVDYDPAVNNGNWQWVASTGCDAQPYFRIFNPWLQQKRFDPQCLYIKRWIPELAHVPTKVLHAWRTVWQAHQGIYMQPMVEHEHERVLARKMFSRQ